MKLVSLIIVFYNLIASFSLDEIYVKSLVDTKKEIGIDSCVINDAQIIQSCENNTVVDLPAGTMKDSALVSLWRLNGGINQAWKIEKKFSGLVIKSEISKKFLITSNKDSSLIQQEFNASPYQYWEIIPEKKYYRIRNVVTNLYLTNEKNNLKLSKRIRGKTQLWQLRNYNEYIRSLIEEKILSPREMREDIDYFIKSAKNIHPNLFAYTTKKAFNIKVNNLLTKMNKPMPIGEFSKLLTPLINSSFDGHTSLPPLSGNMESIKKCSFPFKVNIHDGRISIIEAWDRKFNYICPSEIKSINGISSDSIYKYALKYFPFENLKMKEKFIIIYFPIILKEIFQINAPYELILNTTRENKFTIDCCQDINFNPLLFKQNIIPPYKFIFIEEHQFGILELNTFSFSQEQLQKFNNFLDSTFNYIKMNKCNSLVIDISRNTGGDSFIAEQVLDYISMTQFSYLTYVEQKLSKFIKKEQTNDHKKLKILEYFKTPKSTNEIISKAIRFNRNGSKIDYYHRTLKNEHEGFNGKVYLLQSSLTYSAAVSLSYLFFLTGRGSIIGEPTGGYINCYIESQNILLPNSKIPATVSRKKCQVSSDFHPGGVLPDLCCNIEFDSLSYNHIFDLIIKADKLTIVRNKKLYNDLFGNYYYAKEKERKMYWQEKKYLLAIETLQDLERSFYKLQKKYRPCYLNEIQTIYYNIACAYSLLHDSQMSIKFLEKAFAAGYNNYFWINEDPDLEFLRNSIKYKRFSKKINNCINPHIL